MLKKVALLSAFGLVAGVAMANPMVTPITVSSQITLGPAETQFVYLDTNKLPTLGSNHSYTISCPITDVNTPSSNSVYNYIEYSDLPSASLTLTGNGINDPVDPNGGLLSILDVGQSYTLTATGVDISVKDPLGIIKIKNVDGKGSFTIGQCEAIPQ